MHLDITLRTDCSAKGFFFFLNRTTPPDIVWLKEKKMLFLKVMSAVASKTSVLHFFGLKGSV